MRLSPIVSTGLVAYLSIPIACEWLLHAFGSRVPMAAFFELPLILLVPTIVLGRDRLSIGWLLFYLYVIVAIDTLASTLLSGTVSSLSAVDIAGWTALRGTLYVVPIMLPLALLMRRRPSP